MRLEVLCEDRLGLTRELLDILASKSIDLRGIEIDISGIIYLNCPDIDFDTFSELMAEIRRIPGLKTYVKSNLCQWSATTLSCFRWLIICRTRFLQSTSKVLSIWRTCLLCRYSAWHKQEVIGTQIGALLPSVRFSRWSEGVNARTRENLVIDGLDYILELMPVYIRDEAQNSTLASTLMTIRTSQHGTQIEERLPLHNPLGFEHFVGISNRHKALINQAKKLSVLDQPLLIEGETGTGKEMLAKACHSRSSRASKPFLVLSCASMPDDVAETELFGHAPGSFNHEQGHKGIFEQANGGTVFLDEIGEMSAHLQIKLLRFLQDGNFRRVGAEDEMHVDVRIIASTKHNLAELSEAGMFREDLYYRLNVLTLSIPPLRKRSNDVAPLLDLFVTKHAQQLGIDKPELDEGLVDALASYQWPGNMRQLDNMVLRALTEMDGHLLKAEHFNLPQPQSVGGGSATLNIDGSLDEIMRDYESQVLERLYQSFPSSRKLAKRLNVSHTSIANKLRDYGIRKN